MIGEFKKFAMRGSVIDMAVGIVIGGSFAKIANSLVTDVILPPIGLALHRVDFSNLFINLSGTDYNSLTDAQAAGAPTINYGLFLNNTISFFIIAFALFLLIKQVNKIRGEEKKAKTVACPHCFSKIPTKATRCPFCTSKLLEKPAK
ncbi:MAG: large conductance mechanosensitive channel protein MscL [Candidatus Moraniibacteriota bacterium]